MALNVNRLDDEYYNFLKTIFEQFKYSTGIFIDQYSDTKLSINNFKFLIKLIDQYIEKTDLDKNKRKTILILEFRGLLNLLVKYNIPVKLIGD